MENRCPQGEASKKTKGKSYEIKAMEAQETDEISKSITSVHCNRCSYDQHATNSYPLHHFHIKREEVHIMRDGCCSTSPETSKFEYDIDDLSKLYREDLMITKNCRHEDP
jgi:hypothetical protein